MRYEITAKLRDGTTLILRGTKSTDFYAMCAVMFDDVYQVDRIKNPKIIVDVGANIGAFTVLVAKKFPGAKIVAVEPEPENVRLLKRNIALNKLTNIEVRQCAVSNSYGKAKLFLNREQPSAHSLHGGVIGSLEKSEFIEVDIVPLSEFGKMDALKVDCEGEEVTILDTHIPECQYVAVEFDTDDKDRIIQQFIAKGYTVHNQESNNCVFVKK